MKRDDFKPTIIEALRAHGGVAYVVDIAKYIWRKHDAEIVASGDMFYTWQYDMRWAGNSLVKEGLIVKGKPRTKEPWRLV